MTSQGPNSRRVIIESYEKQFQYYRSLGERSFAQIPDEAFFFQYSGSDNNIAIIVKHLWGNMLSRWTDFQTSDGEKEWRRRDEEFIVGEVGRDGIITLWNEGWSSLFKALSVLDDPMLQDKILIRNQEHTIMEAINRQLAHYAYHVGQIVLLAKSRAGESWNSLSIPRNQSVNFNAQKFSQEQDSSHYTDEWVRDD